LYASIAKHGTYGQGCNTTKAFQKLVLTCYKREITVAQEKTTLAQALQTNKKLIKQLNTVGVEGEVVAVCKLQSRDIVLTTDKEQTCTR